MASNLVRRLANSTFSFVVQDGRPHETGAEAELLLCCQAEPCGGTQERGEGPSFAATRVGCRGGALPVLPGGAVRLQGGGPSTLSHPASLHSLGGESAVA